MHFAGLFDRLGVHEVVVAPGGRVVVLFPLEIDVEQGEMVAFGHEELLSGVV